MANNNISLRNLVKLPDFVSLASVTCGIISMLLSTHGKFTFAAIFLIAAVFCDWVDGKIATLMNRREKFGVEMDSLSDTISFAVAPVIFGYFIGLSDFYSILILIIFASASILRLARFNLAKMESHFDIGLPTTVNGIGLPALYFLIGFSGISWIAAKWLYLLYFLLSSILMVSSVRARHFKVFGED